MRRLIFLLLIWLTALGVGRSLLTKRVERQAPSADATFGTAASAGGDYAGDIAAASVLTLLAIVPPLVLVVIWKRRTNRN